MSTRVLLTGASGFIGSAVLKVLSKDPEIEVHAVGRSKPNKLPTGTAWTSLDLMSFSDVRDFVSALRPSHLLHSAWIATHGDYWSSPNNLDWVGASLNLLRAFQSGKGQRILIVGTSAEYDWSRPLSDENNTPICPKGLYGVSKNALREILASYCLQTEMSWAWARLFCVYGPGEPPEKLLPKYVNRLLNNESVAFSGGHELRDFLHVTDAGSALAAVLKSPLSGPVNIASGQAVSIRQFVREIAEQIGRSNNLVFENDTSRAPGELSSVVPCVSKLRNGTGWLPNWNLTEGIATACHSLLNARNI